MENIDGSIPTLFYELNLEDKIILVGTLHLEVVSEKFWVKFFDEEAPSWEENPKRAKYDEMCEKNHELLGELVTNYNLTDHQTERAHRPSLTTFFAVWDYISAVRSQGDVKTFQYPTYVDLALPEQIVLFATFRYEARSTALASAKAEVLLLDPTGFSQTIENMRRVEDELTQAIDRLLAKHFPEPSPIEPLEEVWGKLLIAKRGVGLRKWD